MENQTGVDLLFKIVIVGDSGVGKSALLLRFTEDFFSESFESTIGVEFSTRVLHVNGKNVKMQIWDTAGHERFRTITNSYYRGASGALVVFDLSNEVTLENTKHWFAEIEKYAKSSIPIVLVGAKADLPVASKVREAAVRVARDLGVLYYEISSKNSENVEKPFVALAQTLIPKDKKK